MTISLLFILALIFFILALILTKKNKTNFLIGVIYTIVIILLTIAIYMIYTNDSIINAIEIFIRQVMQYVTYIISILFIYNGAYNTFAIQKTRKNNITDLLSFLAGITLIMLNILTNNKNGVIYIIIDLLLFYLDVMFISYIVMSILCKIYLKKSKYDVLIVLGAGLVDGVRPSRTLLNRLNKALEVYSENSYIVVSGGKGNNEKISEAESMKNYLIEHGIKEDKIILEDKSTNTYENLKYSIERIKEELQINSLEDLKIAFVSSDFHIYRTHVYAKEVGLNSDGVGAKTLFYYYPNAFIREYAAIVVKYKKGPLIYLIFSIIIFIILLTK